MFSVECDYSPDAFILSVGENIRVAIHTNIHEIFSRTR